MRCTRAVPGRVVRRFYYSLRIMQKYNILELNEKLLPELQSIAEELGIKKVSSLKKEELVYRILDEQAISYAGIQAEKEKEKEAKKAERQTKAKKTKAAAPKGAKADAKTKAAASQIVLNAVKQGLNASIVHPSGIIGPGDYGRTHLTQLVISYLNGTLTACVNGGYDFVDVRDVADGIISCVENGRAGECYILSNQFYTIQEVLDDLHEITGKRRLKSVLPLWFAKLTAPLAEVWYKMLRQPPLYTSYSLYTLESNGNFSHEKATQELGYHPRSMKDTLTDMAYWLESYNRIKFKFKTAHAV